ncbi:Rab32/38 family gtpase, partial [Globisporangium splendens]
MRKYDTVSTLFNKGVAPSAATDTSPSAPLILQHRSSDLARAMAEQQQQQQQQQREHASEDGAATEREFSDDMDGVATLEEVDDDDTYDGSPLVSEGSNADDEDDDNGDEDEDMQLANNGEEDVSKMGIEEVRLRLAELENATGPTKEEINAMLAQYSDYSDGSYDSDLDGEGRGSGDSSSSDDGDSGSHHQETVIMKVLIVGNARCGKTSTIRQFVSKQFSENYVSTIGADFVEKIIEYDTQLKISLQLWDIAGQDRFAKLTRAYFREAKGALIVCDITRGNTIDAIVNWKSEIDLCSRDLNDGESIPVVMVANKSDLLDDPVGALNIGVNMQKCVVKNGIVEWFRTSAKNGDSVDDAFKCLIDRMVEDHRSEKQRLVEAAADFEKDRRDEVDEANVAQHRRRDDDIIRLDQPPPMSYGNNSSPFGCECN